MCAVSLFQRWWQLAYDGCMVHKKNQRIRKKVSKKSAKVSMSQHAECQHATPTKKSEKVSKKSAKISACWLLLTFTDSLQNLLTFANSFLLNYFWPLSERQAGLVSAIYGCIENSCGLSEPVLLACTSEACRISFCQQFYANREFLQRTSPFTLHLFYKGSVKRILLSFLSCKRGLDTDGWTLLA